MLSFKNLKGMEGIDKLNECAVLIDEIFGDKEITVKVLDLKESQKKEDAAGMYEVI